MQNTTFHIISFTFFLLNVYFNISLAGNVLPGCLTSGRQVFWVDVYTLFVCPSRHAGGKSSIFMCSAGVQ